MFIYSDFAKCRCTNTGCQQTLDDFFQVCKPEMRWDGKLADFHLRPQIILRQFGWEWE